MAQTSEEIYLKQYRAVVEKFVDADNGSIFHNMNPIPMVESEYLKFKDDEDLYGMFLEQESISEKISFIHDVIVLETFAPIYLKTKTILTESEVSFEVSQKLDMTEQLLETSMRSRLMRGIKENKWVNGIFKTATAGVAGSGILAYFGALTTATAGLALSIPLVVYLVGGAFVSTRTNQTIRKSQKAFMKGLSDVITYQFSFDTNDSDTIEKVLDNMDIDSDILRKFENKPTFNMFAIPTECEQDIQSKYHTKFNITKAKVRSRGSFMKWVGEFSGERNAVTSKAVYDFRECVLEKLMVLYKLKFAELFAKYQETESTKYRIEQNSSLKDVFTYFERFSRSDRKFKESFEFLITLRNLLEEYLEILEIMARKNFYNRTGEDIDLEFQQSELNNSNILAKWLAKELKSLDHNAQKAINDTIGELEKEENEEELKQAELDKLREKEDEKLAKEKEEKEKADKIKKLQDAHMLTNMFNGKTTKKDTISADKPAADVDYFHK